MRTFVAVEVSDDNVLNSIANLQSDLKISAKPVSRENMHFTLFFLGETSDSQAEKIMGLLGNISFSPIQVSFVGVGAFPNAKSPRVIWLGVDDNAAKILISLAKQVEEKLAPFGFKSDKPFKPHLTIFRIKNRDSDVSQELDKFKTVSLGQQTISELKFKKSILTSSGPIYSDLQVVKAKQ